MNASRDSLQERANHLQSMEEIVGECFDFVEYENAELHGLKGEDPHEFFKHAAKAWSVDIGDKGRKKEGETDSQVKYNSDCVATYVFNMSEYPYTLIGRSDHVLKVQVTGPYISFSLLDYQGKLAHKIVYVLDREEKFRLHSVDNEKVAKENADGSIVVEHGEKEAREILKRRHESKGKVARILAGIKGVMLGEQPPSKVLDAQVVSDLTTIVQDDISKFRELISK